MRRSVCRTLLGMMVLVGAMSGLGTTASAGMFLAGVSGGDFNSIVLGPSPASGSFSNNTNGSGSSSASAFSNGGILGGSAVANSTGVNQFSNFNAAAFTAKAIIDDIIISGPADDVDIQVSAIIHGLIMLSGAGAVDATSVVAASLVIYEPLHSSSPFAMYSPATFGAPTDTEINVTLTTSAVTLPTDTPLTVELLLQGRVVASDNFSVGSANASIDFLNTMSFPTNGAVFILPNGFTANSVSGNIVDNQFVGVSTTSPVPEPSSFALLGTACIALVGYGWQRRLCRPVRLGIVPEPGYLLNMAG